MLRMKTKVCIVGSGIAGCLCAKFLSEKVDDILIVERGAGAVLFPYYGYSYFTAHCYHFYDGVFRRERAGALGDVMNIAGLSASDITTFVATERGLKGKNLRSQSADQFRHEVSIAFLLDDVPNPDRSVRIGIKRNAFGIPITGILNHPASAYLERAKGR